MKTHHTVVVCRYCHQSAKGSIMFYFIKLHPFCQFIYDCPMNIELKENCEKKDFLVSSNILNEHLKCPVQSCFFETSSCTHERLWSRPVCAPAQSHQRYLISLTDPCITKTCLYNTDPLKPHVNIVKLGFTGVYIIFLISAQKHTLWVLVRPASPRRF